MSSEVFQQKIGAVDEYVICREVSVSAVFFKGVFFSFRGV
jgi:hypothetical protein